ncbi:MAG: SUMF1/EgtB/PvdO family nonheme iron enzyme [Opitutaceae bacterium]|nr:SUMF1/EgtB/PvdO family nonheme iron enzyme [Opitutaceae bacterium]
MKSLKRGWSRFLLAVLLAPVTLGASFRLAVVTDAADELYQHTVKTAIAKAGQDAGLPDGALEIVWRAPMREGDRQEQVRLLRDLARDRVDAVLLAPIDRKELAPSADEARREHRPLVCFGGMVDAVGPLSVVMADNLELGRSAARRLAARLNGHGRVILLRSQIHASAAEQREEGFLEILQREYPGIELVATDYHAGPTSDSAQRVMTGLLDRYGRDLQGIFVSSEPSAVGALMALRNAGLAGGQVKFVAVDDGGVRLREGQKVGDIQELLMVDLAGVVREAARFALAQARAGASPARRVVGIGAGGQRELRDEAPPFWPGLPAITGPEKFAATTSDRTVPDMGLVLVAIPPGVMSRSSGERPGSTAPVQVSFSRPYWLGKYEVTQGEWLALMDSNPSDFVAPCLPVDNVSWREATDFCMRLTERERQARRLPPGYLYALPTEAQWEYACRAGAEVIQISPDDGWCRMNSGTLHPAPAGWRMSTHPMGTLRGNAWGLHDMLGNVAEWCSDWSGDYPGGAIADYSGPASGTHRVLRGGSWWSDPQNCRSDHRHRAPPDRKHSALGFRVALVPAPPSPS